MTNHPYLKNPPRKHAWPHHSRAVTIILSSIVLLSLLSILFVSSPPSVGKAIAGSSGSSVNLSADGGAAFIVTINPGTAAVRALYFELAANVSLCEVREDITVSGLRDISRRDCQNGRVIVGGGSISQTWTAPFSVTVTLRQPLPLGNYEFTVWPVDAYTVFTSSGYLDLFPDDDPTPLPFVIEVALVAPAGLGAGSSSSSSGGSTPDIPNTGGSPSGSSSSSSGGSYCDSEWSCGDWSLCNASLLQRRDCVDTECSRQVKHEVKSCQSCQESWICTTWNDCRSSQETRTCVDEHACGTALLKPAERRSCVLAGASTQSVVNSPPPLRYTPPAAPPAQPAKRQWTVQYVWKEYKIFVTGIPVALILLVIIILLLSKRHHTVQSRREMHGWVRKAREKGVSDKDIRTQLAQTGWSALEMEKALG